MNDDTRKALEAIAAKHGLTLDSIRGKGKFRAQVTARVECYKYLWNERAWSTPQIGKLFNRHHTTVVFAIDNKGTSDAKRARLREAHRRDPWSKPLGARIA